MVAAWRETVVCASAEAREAGVRPGMSQRQAQQLCPDAELLDPDPAGAARLAELKRKRVAGDKIEGLERSRRWIGEKE